jgi:hypothetical protein
MKAVEAAIIAAIGFGCGAVTFAEAAEVTLTKELRAAMQELMVNTKVVAVTKLDGPADSHESDDDPMTLEIVMLTEPSDGPSRVSHDGEVIFMQKEIEGKEQEMLFTSAFYLKAQRKLAAPR